MRSVLHLIDQLSIGGAQTHLLAVLKASRSDGRYRHLVCSLTETGEIGQEIERLGVRVIALQARNALRRKQWWSLIARVRALCRQEAVTVLHAHLTWSRLLGVPGARLAGVPVIIALEQGDLYTGWPYRLANRLIQYWLTEWLTCSEAMKRWLVEHYHVDPRRVAVMPNCVAVEEFTPSRSAATVRGILGLPEGVPVFGTIGTLGTGIRKGVDVCLRAAAELKGVLPEFRMLVIGDGPERAKLEQLSHELGLDNRVLFLGSRRDTPDLLQVMDLFVLASDFEPFGIVLLEAMCLRRPVVATATGGIPEVVEDGVTGLLVPRGDIHRMAQSLRYLCTHPQIASQLGEAGRQRVLALFTAQRYITALYGLYDRHLAKRGVHI